MNSVDQIFLTFIKGVFIIFVLYALGMTAVIIWGDDALAVKLINTWSSMFGAFIGLGSGYLLGRSRATQNEPNKEE